MMSMKVRKFISVFERTSSGTIASTIVTKRMTRRSRCMASRLCTEQTGWPDEQNQNEDEENSDLAETFAEKEPGQTLDDTDEQAADESTRDRPHAAEDDDGEGDEH